LRSGSFFSRKVSNDDGDNSYIIEAIDASAAQAAPKAVLKAKASVHTAIREVSCAASVAGSPFCESYAWVAQSEAHIYFAQAFKARGDLESWLLGAPGRKFEEGTARFYVAQVALALRALHGAGLVHRDVKASNVLVDASGALSLTDWGLSVFLHRCSTGQPDYARVCRGGAAESTDMCCLGCQHVRGR
jgi:serine/threonine protein kinase